MRFLLSPLSPLLPGLLFYLSLTGCDEPANTRHPEIRASSVEAGARLARQYCGSCHAFPDPSLLPSSLWQTGILPNMGPRLGIVHFNGAYYPKVTNDRFLSRTYYPDSPLISAAEWQHIIDYYVASAPDSLGKQQRIRPLRPDLSGFEVLRPSRHIENPSTCFLRVDSITHPHTLLTSDVIRQDLLRLDTGFRTVDSLKLGGPVLDAIPEKYDIAICDVGRINPTNGRFGSVERALPATGKGGKAGAGPMRLDSLFHLDSLARPVQVLPGDLNQDGLTDYLVCEFGYLTGALTWFEQEKSGKYSRHVIKGLPGAIRAYSTDYNGDGRPDLVVLFAQGEEGVFLFTNQGNGRFSEREVLRFPPVQGSSYFELADFNGDGQPDILYTSGDNADYSPTLKPYHGVYIYINDGRWNFKQKYFFPMNGCFRAVARDFDGDGDLDIAAVAFFADFVRQPEEGFVYLENRGNYDFYPHSLPGTETGRWITMAVDDFDGDGRPDIFLGNFSVAPSFLRSATDWTKGPPFLYLRNVFQRTSKVKEVLPARPRPSTP